MSGLPQAAEVMTGQVLFGSGHGRQLYFGDRS